MVKFIMKIKMKSKRVSKIYDVKVIIRIYILPWVGVVGVVFGVDLPDEWGVLATGSRDLERVGVFSGVVLGLVLAPDQLLLFIIRGNKDKSIINYEIRMDSKNLLI